jgi:hypothetical protein
MDFDLELLIARTSILTTRQRIINSIQDIERKAPDRLDYLTPMRNSEERLLHAHFVFDALDKEFRAARQRAADLEYKLLVLYQEHKKLKQDYAEMQELWENL